MIYEIVVVALQICKNRLPYIKYFQKWKVMDVVIRHPSAFTMIISKVFLRSYTSLLIDNTIIVLFYSYFLSVCSNIWACHIFICSEELSNETKVQFQILQTILLLGFLTFQKLVGLSDRAATLMINLFNSLLKCVATVLGYDILRRFTDILPKSLYTAWKTLKLERDDFDQYAVCPKCHAIYPYHDVVVVQGDIKKCSFVRWPMHPQRSKRKPCHTQLVKGRSSTPKRVYCVRPASSYLEALIKQSDFVDRCNLWRLRRVRENVLADVYDGKLWKTELNSYLKHRTNLYGMLNVDWFQPFKHSPYSLGAIYMVILNLPRVERFKESNVLLLGVIPGPSEPKLHLNSYLAPRTWNALTMAPI